ncbi:MAG: glucosaminidase domain-containing protein [Eubacteriales bacterium]|nr:glucosaminidase domain-containing protein [Eubacteriales bacterium]
MRYIRIISILLGIFMIIPLFTVGASAATLEQVDYFISIIGPMATEDMRQNGILASLTMAQAMHESGFGTSNIAVKTNNLFGMKAYSSWKGRVYCTKTGAIYTDFEEAEAIIGTALYKTYTENFFRVYSSWAESVSDHSKLFNTNDRYANLRGLTDYRLAARYVVEDGYCGDPGYTETLIYYIEKYELYNYDINIPDDGTIDSVDIGVDELRLEAGKSITVYPAVTPSTATGYSFSFTSSDTSVATVSQSGVIQGLSTGRTVITVKAGSKTDNAVVYVHQSGVILYTGITTGMINCRSVPSSDGGYTTVLGSFAEGTALIVFGDAVSGGWYLVCGRGLNNNWITGYSYGSYVSITGTFNGDTPVDPDPGDTDPGEDTDPFIATSYQIGVTTGRLNQRTGPAASYPLVGTFAVGTNVLLIGEPDNGWYYCVGYSESGKVIEGYSGGAYINVLGGFLATSGLPLTEKDGYITGISLGRTVSNLQNALKYADIEVYNKSGVKITGDSNLANGCVLKFTWCGKVYVTKTLLIAGDINCDGVISALDYISLRLHILSLTPLTGVAYKAACITGNSTPCVMDYITVRLNILGISN